MRTAIRGGWIVGYQEPTHTLLRDGIVVFEDDVIIHVGYDFDGAVDREIDATGKLVSPGFIDTHVHSGHRASHRLITDVGRPDYFGQPFLEILTAREGSRVGGDPSRDTADDPSAASEIPLWSKYTVADLLRGGITTFVEFGSAVDVQDQLLRDIAQFGIRGYLGPGFYVHRWVGGKEGKLVRKTDLDAGRQQFDEAVSFVERVDGTVDGRVHGILVPRGVDLSSLEQLKAASQLARALNMPIAVHAAYSVIEFYEVVHDYMKTPIELLESIGMLELGSTVNIGHGNLVAESPRIAYSGGRDIEIMGRYGCTVSHCPINLVRRARFLDSWKTYVKAGINMALGTDTFPRDLIMQMRMASYMGKLLAKDLSSAPAQEVFAAATLGGAQSLGRPDLGRLSAGAKADIILIDQTRIGSLRYGAIRDPVRSLVECGVADDVETVFVDGVMRMENRVIPGVDFEQLQGEAQAAGEWMWEHWHEWDPEARTADLVNPWSYPLLDR